MRSHQYFVYIATNRRGTLYTGVTNDLEVRLAQHEAGLSGFTARYRRLLYVDTFSNVNDAIAAEKHIKGWTRDKKLALIRERNAAMRDLAWHWRRQRSGPGSYIGLHLTRYVTLTKEESVHKKASDQG